MRELNVEELSPIEKLPGTLLHPSSVVIRKPGQALSEEILELLKKHNVEKVLLLAADEVVESARLQIINQPMAVDELKPGLELPRPIYDERGSLLLEAGNAIPPKLGASLKRRNIETIYLRRPEAELNTEDGRKIFDAIESLDKKKEVSKSPELSVEAIFNGEEAKAIMDIKFKESTREEFSPLHLNRQINSSKHITVAPEGEPMAATVQDTRKTNGATQAEKTAYRDSIKNSLSNLQMIFSCIGSRTGTVNVEPLEEIVTQLLSGLIHNRDLLTLCGTQPSDVDYLVHHSLATAIVAVNVGTSMNYGKEQIKGLAYGALLSDVGMLRVSKEIIQKINKLSNREQAEIRYHPVYGLDMLQKVNRLPTEVPYIVYQSHERSNGTGYPCGKKDVVIHTFAKIVGAADSYTAMIAERPYRPRQTAYQAMERLVFMTSEKLLNPQVTRSFLQTHSLFPIGSFIRLSNDNIARVIASNPEQYTRPFVAEVFDRDGKALKKINRVNMMENEALKIVEVMPTEKLDISQDPAIGF